MSNKKIKTPDEIADEARQEVAAQGITPDKHPVAHALLALGKGLIKLNEQNESLKSPEQKAREMEASRLAQIKYKREKALKESQRRTTLFISWCKRDTWLIEPEALHLLMCKDPGEVNFLEGPTRELASFLEGCAGHSLQVVNLKDSKSKWRVKPVDWVTWAKSKGHPIPTELADVLFPKPVISPSITKATERREQKKRDRQRYLKTFAFQIAERAREKGFAWDASSIPVTKSEFLDAFYLQYPQVAEISMTTFDHDIAEIKLKFKPGTKTNPDNVLAKILK